jgi:hypothetical protein
MRRRGLLHKIRLHFIVIFVLCFQVLGSYQIFNITPVKAEITEGTDPIEITEPLEPMVTITSPQTGDYHNQTTVSVSGSVGNFGSGVSVVVYSGGNQFPAEVVDGTWSSTFDLQTEGPHSIYAIASDSEGKTDTSPTIDITIDTTPPPTVTFVSPIEGSYSKFTIIEGKSEPLSKVQVCVNCELDINGKVVGDWKTVSTDSTGEWEYDDIQMAERSHIVYARAKDLAGNVGSESHLTFTLDKTRPVVSPDVFPKPDMTQVPVTIETIIRVKIIESNLIIDQDQIDKSIIVTNSNGSNVPGIIKYDTSINELTFTPASPWARSTKYHVFISPLGLIDSAENIAFPRFWSFTTESALATDLKGKKVFEIAYNGKTIQHESPHASYANNVNICVNCHNTHDAKGKSLLDQKETTTNATGFSVDDYCRACHDGTVAPMPENSQNEHTHDVAVSMKGKQSDSSCASCHNPHSDWTNGNPNLVQSHISYTHTETPSTIPDMVKPTGEISSKDQLCESCHESDSADRIAEADGYRLFRYEKSNTAIGIYEDYDLCLRCHNPNFKEKYEATPDIAGYYDYWTEETKKQYEEEQVRLGNPNYLFSQREISEQEKKYSGHIIKAQDGSSLAGHLPCAECHDTHGSNNIKQLKTRIGHESPQTFDAKIGDWDVAKERDFCVKCHNGETAIYGVIGSAIYDKTSGIAIDPTKTAHNKENTQACSECHSNNNSFSEAVHAPKRVKENPQ